MTSASGSTSAMMNKGKVKIGLNLSKLEIGKKPTEAGQAAAVSSGFGSFGSAQKPQMSIENEVRKHSSI